MTRVLHDKVALVTGGSRGIGRGIAERLARDGALVTITYNTNESAANETVSLIESEGGRALALQAALENPRAIGSMFDRLDEELAARTGEPRLDIVVNNAGGSAWATFEDATPENFDAIFAVNARAPFFVLQAAAGRLREGGRIINISTGLTRHPSPQAPLPVYTMAKAGIDVLSRDLAVTFGARGITVNVVAPGWTETDANAQVRTDPDIVARIESETALGRFGRPDDIASVVAFLASPEAGWVTGQYIEASGGHRI
jgi:3-oxoacyl-[acyl-carrier protein] reductase